MESSEAGLFAECVHLECCTEVRPFVDCFICVHVARKFAIFVCFCIFLFCVTDKHFNM